MKRRQGGCTRAVGVAMPRVPVLTRHASVTALPVDTITKLSAGTTRAFSKNVCFIHSRVSNTSAYNICTTNVAGLSCEEKKNTSRTTSVDVHLYGVLAIGSRLCSLESLAARLRSLVLYQPVAITRIMVIIIHEKGKKRRRE